MVDIINDILGITGYDYLVIWISCVILTISIYCLFKVLLTILLRVGGYD